MTKEEFIKNLLDSGFKKMSLMFAEDHMFRTDNNIVIYMYMYDTKDNQLLTVAILLSIDEIYISLYNDYGEKMIGQQIFKSYDEAWEYLCE